MSSAATPGTASKPVLVYDGDCAFCCDWVDYWRRLTGAAVEYRPYQEVAARYPDVAPAAFRGAIHFFAADGSVSRGAAAAFELLALCPGRGGSRWCYRHLPGFAPVAEALYGVIARHRVAAARVSRLLWGPTLEPAQHQIVAWLLLRLLGLIYLAAFVSFTSQALGLIGTDGILPLREFMLAVREQLGDRAFWWLPSLFWLDQSDWAIRCVGTLGALAAGSLVLGIAQRSMLVLLYVLYLSVFYAGQDFYGFQWDLLLLEVGFLAIFLPGGATSVIWLFRWLSFRFLFLAGIAKILSGDATWRGLTALRYHFETQPLPSPLAWYAHQLPEAVLTFGTAAVLIVELVVPFLIFLPRRPRFLAAWCVLIFQLLVAITGNYNFFNLLTMLLCLSLLDDAALRGVLPGWLVARAGASAAGRYRPWRAATLGLFAASMICLGLTQMFEQITRQRAWQPFAAFYRLSAPFCVVNGYGLFAHMTTTRPEIIIEGSADGEHWRAYEFRYKPGDLQRAPRWNIPHQPRLDWQMWFAALGTADQNPWFGNLMLRLLQGSPDVLALFDSNPFPARPPRLVRARLYDYRFASVASRRASGAWWARHSSGLYFPVMDLRSGVGVGRD